MYTGRARSVINAALIILSAVISIQGFVISETHIKPRLSCWDIQQKICYEAHSPVRRRLLADRTRHNLDINDSMSTVIECLSHFLAATIKKRVARKAREIQKEADKRVEEKGLWRGGKKEKRKTKGREKR